jgi:hypothetical protein
MKFYAQAYFKEGIFDQLEAEFPNETAQFEIVNITE